MAQKDIAEKTLEAYNTENGVKQNKKHVGKIVDDMTLFDDELMSRVFADNIDATELMLRIILGRAIKVTKVTGQYEIKSARMAKRTIKLDIRAIDEDGDAIDIEVQGDAEGSHVRRARYHSSMLDTVMLKKKQPFKVLKDSYVIFMYRADKFGHGLPIYHIHRAVDETGEKFDDGSHIIYINGTYRGHDDLGKLVSDFHQTDPSNMNFGELAEGLRHYKSIEGGRENMSEAVERYARECVDENMTIVVKNLMENMEWSLDQALNALGIKGKTRTYVIKQLQK